MFNNIITLDSKDKNNLIKSKNTKDNNLKIKIAMFLCKIDIKQSFNKDNYIFLLKDKIISYDKHNIAILKNSLNCKYILKTIQTQKYYLKKLRKIKTDSKTQMINPYSIKEKFIKNYDKNTIKLSFSITRTFYINKQVFNNLIFIFKLLNENFHIEYGNLFCPLVFKSKSLTYIFNGVE